MKHRTASGSLTLNITQLEVGYGCALFKPISLELSPGEYVGVVGSSGVGKSTFLRTIAGLMSPLSGNISSFFPDRPNQLEQGKALYLHQTPVMLEHLTVSKGLRVYKKMMDKANPSNATEVTVDSALKEVGLGDALDKYPFELSLGMKTRVSIARSLLSNFDIVLADEPFASLDEERSEKLNLLFERVTREQNGITLHVTHNVVDAMRFCDKVITLSSCGAEVFDVSGVSSDSDRHMLSIDAIELRDKIRDSIYA